MTIFFNHFFNVMTHVLIVSSILGILFLVAKMIFYPSDTIEKTIRMSACTTGFLIYYGSKSIGISIPLMIVKSLVITNPFSIGLFGILIPSLTGYFVAWYCIKNIKKNENIAARLIVLIITFIIVLFGDVYVTAFDVNPINDTGFDITLLPNLTFTIALSLYMILKYNQKQTTVPPVSATN